MSVEKMPAGSMSPNANTDEEQTSEQGGQGGAKDEGIILGKFETPEALAESYQNLEKTLGSQKSELGALRNQVAQLSKPVEDKPVDTNFASARSVVEKQIEDGELSLSDGLSKLSTLTQQETEATMEQKFATYDENRSASDAQADFIAANPGFEGLRASGALEEEMRTNPMHDEVSAYYAVKGRADTEAAFEQGKDEALKLAKGADGTKTVLNGNGQAARDFVQPKKGMNHTQKIDGMLGALSKARS